MATRWQTEQNGIIGDFIIEDGVVHKRLIHPMENQVLKQNQEVKKSGTRMMDWGKMVADIPADHLPVLREFFGEALFNPKHDKWDRKVAREAFLKSPASDPYRTEYRRRQCRHT